MRRQAQQHRRRQLSHLQLGSSSAAGPHALQRLLLLLLHPGGRRRRQACRVGHAAGQAGSTGGTEAAEQWINCWLGSQQAKQARGAL